MPQLVLLKPHTHAGKPAAIGDRIEVDASSAEWLLTHAIAEIAAPDAGHQKTQTEIKSAQAFQPHQSNQRKEPKP